MRPRMDQVPYRLHSCRSHVDEVGALVARRDDDETVSATAEHLADGNESFNVLRRLNCITDKIESRKGLPDKF